MIVVSILLAFGIEAWWAARTERIDVQASLENVATEIAVGRDEIAYAIEMNLERVSRYETVLNHRSDELLALPADSLRLVGESFYPPMTFDPGRGALQTLLEGGSLNAVADPELRNALVAWGRLPDEFDEDYAWATSFTDTFRQRSARHGIFLALASLAQSQPLPETSTLGQAFASLRQDAEAMDLLQQLATAYRDFAAELDKGVIRADSLTRLLAN